MNENSIGNEYCTCGTPLVTDARFCHRCGRPTGEEPLIDSNTPPPLPAQAAPSPAGAIAQMPVSFRNPLALRVAFVMSLIIMLLQMIPGLNLLFVVWWLGAGWAAVAVYRRLTGVSLTVSAGARLGSLTGILAFVSMTLTFALSMTFMGRQLLDEMVKQTPQVEEVIKDPVALGFLFVMVLVVMFAMVVGACAAGGALGARYSARNRPA